MQMFGKLYSRWMYAWETSLTTRDTNRIVRPVEWGFDWLADFAEKHDLDFRSLDPADHAAGKEAMLELNRLILRNREDFFAYRIPEDFCLEERSPQLFPTNVRPETLLKDARIRRMAADGKLPKARFLRFTSPVRSPYRENDRVNARWYPASAKKVQGKPKQAIVVLPQWNADAFSHNALCSAFSRFGVSALRLSKPYHDIRRPSELQRADFAVSSNVGRTLASCRQAVADIRCCLDWLQQQGYEQFGILGTSLGSCYAFLASALDARIQVNAFNHASMSFGDVVWTGQSTRHVRQAFEEAGVNQEEVRGLWAAISPVHYIDQFAACPKKVLVIHAAYDLTFLPEYSLQVLENFRQRRVEFVSKVLPCGHYTTGEAHYNFIDGWYLGSFVYSAFRQLASEPIVPKPCSAQDEPVTKRAASGLSGDMF
jgi:hypothetical protein